MVPWNLSWNSRRQNNDFAKVFNEYSCNFFSIDLALPLGHWFNDTTPTVRIKINEIRKFVAFSKGRCWNADIFWYYILVNEIILAWQRGTEDKDIRILVNCEVTHLTAWRHIPVEVVQHQHRSECLRHGTNEINFRSPDKTRSTLNCFSLFCVCVYTSLWF
jgi:hypothetical protein